MKNIKKFFAIICVMLVSIICFSGCAKVGFSIIVDENGRVEQGFEVALDKEKIENAGYNYQDAKQKVISKMQTIVNNQELNIQYYCFTKGISFLTCGINTGLKQVDSNGTDFYAYVNFNSIALFNDYKKVISEASGSGDEPEEDGKIIEETLFFNKVKDKFTTVYYDIENDDFAKDFLEYFDGEINGNQKFTLDDIEYNFYYGLPDSSLYSEDSEIIYQNNIKIHHWKFNASELNNEVVIYTIQVKPVAWYVLALVLTVALILILFMVFKFRQKFSKQIVNDTENQNNAIEIKPEQIVIEDNNENDNK